MSEMCEYMLTTQIWTHWLAKFINGCQCSDNITCSKRITTGLYYFILYTEKKIVIAKTKAQDQDTQSLFPDNFTRVTKLEKTKEKVRVVISQPIRQFSKKSLRALFNHERLNTLSLFPLSPKTLLKWQ